MPIKFRCDYCRQLLGIAHSKAGSLVDCPTCGRTLRVPNQDGTVDPPPAVGLDLADDGLRRALDELAELGQAEKPPAKKANEVPSAAPGELPSGSEQATRGVSQTPPAIVKPKPKPIVQPRPPQLPIPQSNAIALEPLPPMVVVNPPAPPRASPDGSHQPVASMGGGSPEEIVAGMARQLPTVDVPLPAAVPPVAVRGYALKWLIVASLVSGLIGAALGFGLSRAFTSSRAAAPQTEDVPDEEQHVAPVAKPLVKGRITFRNARGQLEPDAGACLVLLPVERTGAVKLPSAGLRPNDEAATRQAARKSVQEQGGRLVVTDGDGDYHVELPEPGKYRLIALSHYQGRPADDTGPAEARKTVAEIFDRPEQLVGKLAFEVTEIHHDGVGTVIWDHTFDGVRSE